MENSPFQQQPKAFCVGRNETGEQDPKKIGYIMDQCVRYYTYLYDDECDTSVLKQFEPDYKLKNYKG